MYIIIILPRNILCSRPEQNQTIPLIKASRTAPRRWVLFSKLQIAVYE